LRDIAIGTVGRIEFELTGRHDLEARENKTEVRVTVVQYLSKEDALRLSAWLAEALK
jgi:hypothetical protein